MPRGHKGEKYIEMGGRVHMVGPLSGGSHTLCGVAHDAADTEHDESLRWHGTGLFVVECPDCIRVIKACRGQLIREPVPAGRECTCLGTCKGPEGLGPGWRCVLAAPPSPNKGEAP